MPLSDDISQEDIDAYIACIEASAILGRSKRRLRLLTHLMQSEFLGHGDQFKAYSIGLDIFGKPDEFDPATDSVVRVEMGRLRTALALFEASEFVNTGIVVEIPTGTYRPTIHRRMTGDENADGRAIQTQPKDNRNGIAAGLFVFGLAVIAAMFFILQRDAQPDADIPAFGIQISLAETKTDIEYSARQALAQALSRSKVFRLFVAVPEQERVGDAKFDVKLSTSILDDSYRATFELDLS